MKRLTLTLEDFFNIPSGKIYNPDVLKPVTSVSIDSRHISENTLFIAIKGNQLDGHSFIHDAISNNVSAVMINKNKYKNFNDLNIPVITVDDTVKALGYLASVWRQKLRTKVIGITGSSGKTTVKEYISVLLNEKFSVNKTLANNNNHIGVPLTIFSTNNKHDFLVLELGTNHFGEIKYTAEIASPDYAVITNIGSSHLQFLKNKKGVFKEKSSLFDAVSKSGGTIVINKDDKILSKAYSTYRKRITYSMTSDADLIGKIVRYTEDGRPLIELEYKDKRFKVELPVFGEHAANNFMAAAAIGLSAGLTTRNIVKGAAGLRNYEKRFNLKKINNTVLIDDTYNANPDSMKTAIVTLSNMYPGKKKIAILGDMLELGEESKKLHTEIAGTLKKKKIDSVYTIGSMSENIYNFLSGTAAEARHFISRASLKRFLERQKYDDTVILVKGSRGMKMEEFLKVVEDNIS